jgi:hypothetical protein
VRRIRNRASKPIRCDVEVVLSTIGIVVVGVLPSTTGAPVTPGVALVVPGFGVPGIGAGTGLLGVVIVGVAG